MDWPAGRCFGAVPGASRGTGSTCLYLGKPGRGVCGSARNRNQHRMWACSAPRVCAPVLHDTAAKLTPQHTHISGTYNHVIVRHARRVRSHHSRKCPSGVLLLLIIKFVLIDFTRRWNDNTCSMLCSSKRGRSWSRDFFVSRYSMYSVFVGSKVV